MREWLFLLLGLLGSEAAELSPYLMKKLVQWVSRGLPAGHQELMEETWLAELDALPGKLAKLGFILPLVAQRREVLQAIREMEGRSAQDTSMARLLIRVMTVPIAILLFPVIGILALLLLIQDREWPFYKTKKVGCNGMIFDMYVFRTEGKYAADNLSKAFAADPDFIRKISKNPRLLIELTGSRIGLFIIRHNIKYLPSIANVMRGEMSWVGPDAWSPDVLSLYPQAEQDVITKVPPGIIPLFETALPPALSGNPTEIHDKYVRKWSIGLEVYILARTAWRNLRG